MNFIARFRPAFVPARRVFTAFTAITGLILSFGLNGCASHTWSEAQRSKLAQVHIETPAVAKDAYHKPDAKISPGYANSIPTVTGGGLIPALIGSAIDAHVTAKQQRAFEQDNAQYFDALQTAFTAAPDSAVTQALQTVFGDDVFFGPRLTSQPDSGAFKAEILHYGFTTSPYSNEDGYQLRVHIVARLKLTDTAGATLMNVMLEGAADTAKTAPAILEDPAFIPAGLHEAAENLAKLFQSQIRAKLGDDASGSALVNSTGT